VKTSLNSNDFIMKALLLVFVSGGLGSSARYGLSILNPAVGAFPIGTFATNVIACLIAGFAAGWFTTRGDFSSESRLLILTGFCGGFSTFSTFSLESIQLFNDQKIALAVIYIVLSIAACLLGTVAGYWISSK
jgi:fluoride exporter